MHHSPAQNSRPVNIALVGMMGSGKSTIGRTLAMHLRWEFVDTDEVIVERDGRSITGIFAGPGGEPEFRDLETDAVIDAVARDRCVIATGGGAVLRDENREAIWDRCWVVWVRATPEETARRVAQSDRRPVLERYGDPVGAARLIMESRWHLYGEAHHMEDTTGRAVDDIVSSIAEAWTQAR